MASPSDFLPYVLPYVTGCSTPLAEQQILQVCRDFCTHAPIVQERLDPMTALKGQAEYDLDLPSGVDVTLILSAAFEGRPLACFKTGDGGPDSMMAPPGTPTAYQQTAQNTLWLDYAPQSTTPGAITLLVATRPSMKASSVANVLLQDYAYEIGMGAVGRLVLMPSHSFTNPAFAATCNSVYLAARTDARIRAEASFGTAGTRVRPRPFL